MQKQNSIQTHADQSPIGINKEQASGSNSVPPRYEIVASRKFEPSELCEIFVGPWFKNIYLLFLSLYTFCSCPSYAAVAASSWAVNLPINFSNLVECTERDFNGHLLPALASCRYDYWFCLLLFTVIVIPISLLKLKNQILVQVTFGVLRFGVIGCMVVYCLVNLLMGKAISDCANPNSLPPTGNSDNGTSSPINHTETLQEVVTRFDWKGWVVSVPMFTFALLLQQAIPSLTQPVRQKNYLRAYISAVFLIAGLLYMCVGIALSLWFKNCINETSILNWVRKCYPNKQLTVYAHQVDSQHHLPGVAY